MFRTTALLLATCFSSAFAASNTIGADKARDALESFDSIIKQALQDFNIPGVAVGVVVDGQIVYSKGFGLRNMERNLSVTRDTVFGLASCTKAFTSFVAGTMVEEGLIEWDQPIVDVMPQFRLSDDHATTHVTFRDLLAHRSGMARHPYCYYNSNFSRLDLIQRLRYLDMAWDVRERFNYGDLMYLPVAFAMEQISGKTWEELVTEKILKPLGMKNTNFSVEKSKKSDNYAIPYIEKNGALKAMPFRNVCNIGPAAGMNSSLNDMLRWVKLLLDGGTYDSKSLLSAGSLQEIFGSQVIAASYAETPDALLTAYGLGWYIHPYRGCYSVSHDGAIDGFSSVVSLFPNNRFGVIVLTNKNLFPVPRYLSMEIVDTVLGLPSRDWLKSAREALENTKKAFQEDQQIEDTQRKVGTLTSHALEDYTGAYEHPAYGTMQIELKNGSLIATLNGISSRLEHWHYDVFDLAEDLQDLIISRKGLKYTFRTNSHGAIDEVAIPFELKTPDIVFKKTRDSRFSDPAYFRPYVGQYEIYGIIVDIVLRDGCLVALIPGQPNYILEPIAVNEFNVKNDNYFVRFVIGDEGIAKEVLLILPFGAYSAERVSD